jgi:hypothetical protein
VRFFLFTDAEKFKDDLHIILKKRRITHGRHYSYLLTDLYHKSTPVEVICHLYALNILESTVVQQDFYYLCLNVCHSLVEDSWACN